MFKYGFGGVLLNMIVCGFIDRLLSIVLMTLIFCGN